MGKFSERVGRRRATATKISEVLLDFARPLLDAVEAERGELNAEELRTALGIAVVIWNLVELEAQGRWLELPDEARHQLEAARASPGLGAFIDEMYERRRTEFADDHRLIGDFQVRRREGGIVVWAEARAVSP